MNSHGASLSRGARRGMRIAATGGRGVTRRRMRQIEQTDIVAESWQAVGDSLRRSMQTESKANSSR